MKITFNESSPGYRWFGSRGALLAFLILHGAMYLHLFLIAVGSYILLGEILANRPLVAVFFAASIIVASSVLTKMLLDFLVEHRAVCAAETKRK